VEEVEEVLEEEEEIGESEEVRHSCKALLTLVKRSLPTPPTLVTLLRM
jgi:hypothetical protein